MCTETHVWMYSYNQVKIPCVFSTSRKLSQYQHKSMEFWRKHTATSFTYEHTYHSSMHIHARNRKHTHTHTHKPQRHTHTQTHTHTHNTGAYILYENGDSFFDRLIRSRALEAGQASWCERWTEILDYAWARSRVVWMEIVMIYIDSPGIFFQKSICTCSWIISCTTKV